MKIARLLLLALICLPLALQTEAATPTTKKSARNVENAAETDKYPDFDSDMAASLWGRWKRSDTFTQEDYGKVLDLCDVAYDYLNVELQSILDSTTSPTLRQKKALDLDMGKTAQMSLFARSFTTRMQDLAAQGKFSDDNYVKTSLLLRKKKLYMQLNQQACHSH